MLDHFPGDIPSVEAAVPREQGEEGQVLVLVAREVGQREGGGEERDAYGSDHRRSVRVTELPHLVLLVTSGCKPHLKHVQSMGFHSQKIMKRFIPSYYKRLNNGKGEILP